MLVVCVSVRNLMSSNDRFQNVSFAKDSISVTCRFLIPEEADDALSRCNRLVIVFIFASLVQPAGDDDPVRPARIGFTNPDSRMNAAI